MYDLARIAIDGDGVRTSRRPVGMIEHGIHHRKQIDLEIMARGGTLFSLVKAELPRMRPET